MVSLRGRPAVVRNVQAFQANGHGTHHMVAVDYLDDYAFPAQDKVVWELEAEKELHSTNQWPDTRNLAPIPSGTYQAYIDAVRWTSLASLDGILLPEAEDSNRIPDIPLVGPWSAAVQVEDYQLVPVLRALCMPRVSLLLADDVGLGKTIQAGLVTTELILRRNIRRILVVCPASLQNQWQEELKEKFHLDFTIMDADTVRNIERDHGSDVNPWTPHNRVIVSMDYLKQSLVLENFRKASQNRQEQVGFARRPWDLLIVDEAHNLAPRGFSDDSQRTAMMRELTFNFEHRLFLTATPHNGYTQSFTGLLELLDPYRFTQKAEMTKSDRQHRDIVMVRRLKSEIDDKCSTRRFPTRHLHGVNVEYGDLEKAVFAALREYSDATYHTLAKKGKREQNLGRFIFSLLFKRLLSGTYAFARTWYTHIETAAEKDALQLAAEARRRAEEDVGDDAEKDGRERTAAAIAGSWLKVEAPALDAYRSKVTAALVKLGLAKDAVEREDVPVALADGKLDAVLRHIRKGGTFGKTKMDALVGDPKKPSSQRILLFTEYRDTQRYLKARLAAEGYKDTLLRELYGGMPQHEREVIKDVFTSPENEIRILLATDAASEGLNLQASCFTVLHYDLPWNPMRLEQRNGRVDRHGQPSEDVHVYHYNSDEDEEGKFLRFIAEKVHNARNDIGSTGHILDEAMHRRFYGPRVNQSDVSTWFDAVRKRTSANEDAAPQAVEEAQFHEIKRRFDRHSLENHLTPEAIKRVVKTFLAKQQCTITDQDGVLRISNASGRVKRLVESHLYTREGNIPTLVFDANKFLEPIGKRLIYRPKRSQLLMRIGHPVTQAALSYYRRQMWGGDLSRWTLQEHTSGPEIYIQLDYLVTARNELQEAIHSSVESWCYHVTSKGLALVKTPPELEIAGDLPPGEIAAAWGDRLDGDLHAAKASIDAQKTSALAAKQTGLVSDLAIARGRASARELKEFDERIKEIRREGRDQYVSKYREELVTAEKKQATLFVDDGNYSETAKQLIRESIQDAKDKLDEAAINAFVRNQESLFKRLKLERQRYQEHVLPKRYSLGGNLQFVEIGIRAFIPKGVKPQ